MIPWQKPAHATEDFVIDFADVLGDDNLVDAILTPADGVIVGRPSVYPKFVKFRVGGGTAGTATQIDCICNTETTQVVEATALLDIL